jgi:hypothetical protein
MSDSHLLPYFEGKLVGYIETKSGYPIETKSGYPIMEAIMANTNKICQDETWQQNQATPLWRQSWSIQTKYVMMKPDIMRGILVNTIKICHDESWSIQTKSAIMRGILVNTQEARMHVRTGSTLTSRTWQDRPLFRPSTRHYAFF